MKKEYTKTSLLELLKPYRVNGDKLYKAKKEILFEKAYELKLLIKEIDPNPPECNESECWIPLRNIDKKIIDWTLIDKDDYDNVNKYSWHVTGNKDLKYAANNYKCRLHVLLLGDAPENHVIDHKNNNGLDNTRKNLRFACNDLNGQNKIIKKETSSIYYGVYKSKYGWCASYSKIHLGSFEIETHAAFAYDTYIKDKFNGEGKINNIVKPDNYVEYKKIKSSLPRGVIKNNKKYTAQYWNRNEKKFINLGTYETTDKASEIYEAYRKEEEKLVEKNWLSQPILRNSDGIAILPVKKKENIVYALVDDDLWHNLMKNKWCTNSRGYVCGLRAGALKLHELCYRFARPDLCDR